MHYFQYQLQDRLLHESIMELCNKERLQHNGRNIIILFSQEDYDKNPAVRGYAGRHTIADTIVMIIMGLMQLFAKKMSDK